MGTTPTADLGRRLGDWLDHQRAAHQTDSELIERFVSDRCEAAFAQLVRRHGPGVLAAARRVAGNPHDAEDVFQATFLVLARKAAAVRRREAVAGWLFAVAARLAARVRADGRKREANGDVDGVSAPPADAAAFDVRAVVDEELVRLPARYRAVIVLCYLHGKTRAEAAAELGRSPGAVKIWLERGRELLRGRLARRGVTAPGGAMLFGLLAERATAAVPAALIESTTKAAVSFAAGGAAAGAASATVLTLATGGIKAMFWAKLKVWAGCAAAVGLAAGGGGVAWQQAYAQGTPGAGPAVAKVAKAGGDAKPGAAAKPEAGSRERIVVVAGKDAPYAAVTDALRKVADATRAAPNPIAAVRGAATGEGIDIEIDLKGDADDIKKQIDALIKKLEDRKKAADPKPAPTPEPKPTPARETRTFELKVPPAGGARAVAFSPDGKALAAQEGNVVRVYDAATGKLLWESAAPSGVTGITFSPDGKTVTGTLRFDAATGKPVTTFTPAVRSVAIGGDATARVWDVGGGALDPATVQALEKLSKSPDPETAKLAAELLKRLIAARPAVPARPVTAPLAVVPKPPAPPAPAVTPKPPIPPALDTPADLLRREMLELQRAEADAVRKQAEEALNRAAKAADAARVAEMKARVEAEKAQAERAVVEAEKARLNPFRRTEVAPKTDLSDLKAELDALRKKIEAMEKAAPKK